MTVATDIAPPQIDVQRDGQLVLIARVELSKSLFTADLRLGLSAVIEECSGRKSYWGLTHAPGKPDFHRSSSFCLTLGSA